MAVPSTGFPVREVGPDKVRPRVAACPSMSDRIKRRPRQMGNRIAVDGPVD